jgi:diguanylate cyclase (GGDEF)-like protein
VSLRALRRPAASTRLVDAFRGPDMHSLEREARLDFEWLFLWLRLLLLVASAAVLIALGDVAMRASWFILAAVVADCTIAAVLIRRTPEILVRYQLRLRMVDCAIAAVVLAAVQSLTGGPNYDAIYVLFVLAATATHGRRGSIVLALEGTTAVVIGYGFLYYSGVDRALTVQRTIADACFFGVLFVISGAIAWFLMERTAAPLWERAFHDPLTGLPNRLLMRDRLDRAVLDASRTHARVCVLLFDLNDFKGVNDAYGHQVGDLALQTVAMRVRAEVRKSDTVARLGGDEFVVVLPNTDIDGGGETARKIHAAVTRPTVFDGVLVPLGVSIGLACFPLHGQDANTLLVSADRAMYLAKRSGLDYQVA